MKLKGYIMAAVAAATYGTNPAFAIPLYHCGMNANSVLLFRYVLGLPLLLVMLISERRSLVVPRCAIIPVVLLGLLMAFSSLTLFESYNYMNSGIASTLLFVYPAMVTLIMITGFHERFRLSTAICLILMGIGLIMLMHTEKGFSMSLTGFALVMLSALSYSVFIVMTKVNRTVRSLPTFTLLFYELLSGSLLFILLIPCGYTFTLPSLPFLWLNLVALALLPTVVSLLCTTLAIKYIGPTATAIFGAMEPVTAVLLSVIVLAQPLTLRELIGGLLIIAATSLIVLSDRHSTTNSTNQSA